MWCSFFGQTTPGSLVIAVGPLANNSCKSRKFSWNQERGDKNESERGCEALANRHQCYFSTDQRFLIMELLVLGRQSGHCASSWWHTLASGPRCYPFEHTVSVQDYYPGVWGWRPAWVLIANTKLNETNVPKWLSSGHYIVIGISKITKKTKQNWLHLKSFRETMYVSSPVGFAPSQQFPAGRHDPEAARLPVRGSQEWMTAGRHAWLCSLHPEAPIISVKLPVERQRGGQLIPG